MEIKKEINITEILLASLIAFLTILTTFYIYIDYIIKREPHFSSYAVNSLFFLIYNARVTFLISTVFFMVIAVFSTVYFLKKSDPEPSKVGNFSKVPIAQGFLFLFLLLSLLSSVTPSVPGLDKLIGIFGLAAYYEQTVIMFSLVIGVLSIIMIPLIHKDTDKPVASALLSGSIEKNVYNYFYTLIPAALSSVFFYIFYGFTGYDIIFFFLIFVILFIFVKRYGLIITFMLLTLTFGSNAIELVVKPVTSIIYPVLILVFAFLGFISSLFFNSKTPSSTRTDSMDSTGETGKDARSGFQSPSQQGSNDARNRLTDSRELKDKLFIRGVCPHCDSVEFYIKDTGDLECKKCKSIWTGKETEFQSFKVGRNRNYRI
ncbi:MAG: transposase [Thermoplasmatales archaeon]|nr:MAG: transposase [Thermoplasmatales archaeon]